MKKETEKLVFDATSSIVTQNGYELCDVEFLKHSKDNLELILFIYKESGISLDDCEKVHYLVEPIIDGLDIAGDQPYSLSISSLGLERQLKSTRDFERRMGKELEIKLYAPNQDGKKQYTGVLTKVTEEAIELNNSEVLERKQIASAVLKLDF